MRYNTFFKLSYPERIWGYITDTFAVSTYGLMNYEYCSKYDKFLNHLLDNYTYENWNRATVELNGNVIWVENHPYASFTLYPNTQCVRASRRTILKAYKKLKRECF